MFGKSIGVLALTAAVMLGLPDTSQAQIFRWGRGWRTGFTSVGLNYPFVGTGFYW